MNENVETIFAQMFAPQPIPQQVINLFDRANLLASRIDAQQMRAADLALIGAIGSIEEAVEQFKTPVSQTVDTSEPEPDDGPPVPDALPQGQPGQMDAPGRPTQITSLTRQQMQKMTAPELRAHAREFYGLTESMQFGKKRIIADIEAEAMRRKKG
jgi:hypothetical protein